MVIDLQGYVEIFPGVQKTQTCKYSNQLQHAAPTENITHSLACRISFIIL